MNPPLQALGTSKNELIILLGILTALAPLSIDMYLPTFTSLEMHFDTDAAHVQLTLSSFFLAFALGQLIYGPLADRFGRKIPLYGGLVLYITASVASVFASAIGELIVLRFFQALGASAGVVVSRAIVSDLFSAREAAGVYSAMMLVMGAAPMLAPMAGGYLMVLFGWSSIFETLAIFGLFALLLAHFRLGETRGVNPKVDLSPRAVGVRYFSLLKNRHFMGYALASGMAMSGLFAYISLSPFVLMDHFGVKEEHFGWLFGLNAMGFIIGSQINARILKQHSPYEIISIAIIVQLVVASLSVLQAFFSDDLYATILPLFFQIGLLGFLAPNMTALAMAHFSANAGVASAFLGSLQFAIAGMVSVGVGATHSSSPTVLALAMFLCVLVSYILFKGMISRKKEVKRQKS